MRDVEVGGGVVTPREALGAGTVREVVELEEKVERVLRREHPVVFWLTLLIPALGWLGLIVGLTVWRGKVFALKVLGVAVLVEAVAGRFVIIGGAHGNDAVSGGLFMTRLELFWLVTWIDLTVAMLFLYHATFIFKIWRVGPWLERIRDASRGIVERRPWVGRFGFLGVTLYVGLPILGSGAILGSMMGQLLGLSRLATLAAVMAGTLIGNALMLILAEAIMRVPFLRQQHPGVLMGTVVAVGLVLLVVQWRYSRRLGPRAGKRAGGLDDGGKVP